MGSEITFKEFSQWLRKFNHIKVARDHHKLYEEFKGVLSGANTDSPYLSQGEYLELGIKQSIYSQEERLNVYAMYEKYLAFISKESLYDVNVISHQYLDKISAKYDFVIIDEIQDFTNIQLLLILRSIREEGQFILCGDSNQIVHPNFFSWSKIKTLFYTGKIESTTNITRIFHTNYRSSSKVTHLANLILKVKNARLGSVDKESNYLMKSNSSLEGEVLLLKASSSNVNMINEKTRKSTKYAILVIRDELKEAARKQFDTPLVFSIHEAKGLEYENIILYDFISSESKSFLEIIRDVSPEDLMKDLSYARSKNKSDRSIEIYKFYVNALYVAITRAAVNVYWVETMKTHPLLDLLGIEESCTDLNFDSADSSLQEWQNEARKLELQGKQDQADAIRSLLIDERSVPWEVLTPKKVHELEATVLHGEPSKQEKILLLEHSLVYHRFDIIRLLAASGLKAAKNTKKCLDLIDRKIL